MGSQNEQHAKDAYLAELRAQVERLNALIAAVESEGDVLLLDALGAAPASGRPAGEAQVRPDSFFGMTTPKATRAFVEMMGKGNPPTPQAIATALVEGGLDKPENRATVLRNVYTALKRGKVAREFVKIGKNWGLSEWYPSISQGNDDGEKPSPRRKRRRKSKRTKGRKKAKSKGGSAARRERSDPLEMGWHAYLGKRAKEGASMEEAGKEWREIKKNR